MGMLSQYRGLRRELYVLFWGRVVTNMGALIWPMMTLILTKKLGYTAGQASNLMLVVGACMLPCTLLGGRLADRLDKKKLIVCCDLVTVLSYLACGLLPLGKASVVLMAIAGVFAQLEWPSFDALVANLSTPEERERAYSLNYLGANLGLVLAPTLGGILFENHLNLAFIISGLATFSSTVLIFFLVRDTRRSVGSTPSSAYEDERNVTIRQVFSGAPVLGLFIWCIGIVFALYGVSFSFLMPLSMDHSFGDKGALLLGTLTSVNAVTVIVGTPVLTGVLWKLRDVGKLQLGAALEILGCGIFALAGARMILCYGGMIVFTLGEIILSLGEQPYITRRVPASHRGRMSAIRSVGQILMQGILLYVAGHTADLTTLNVIWGGIVVLGFANVLTMFVLRNRDKRQFHLLYEAK